MCSDWPRGWVENLILRSSCWLFSTRPESTPFSLVIGQSTASLNLSFCFQRQRMKSTSILLSYSTLCLSSRINCLEFFRIGWCLRLFLIRLLCFIGEQSLKRSYLIELSEEDFRQSLRVLAITSFSRSSSNSPEHLLAKGISDSFLNCSSMAESSGMILREPLSTVWKESAAKKSMGLEKSPVLWQFSGVLEIWLELKAAASSSTSAITEIELQLPRSELGSTFSLFYMSKAKIIADNGSLQVFIHQHHFVFITHYHHKIKQAFLHPNTISIPLQKWTNQALFGEILQPSLLIQILISKSAHLYVNYCIIF